jgi:hypothetical protein
MEDRAMLRCASDAIGFAIEAADGSIGSVDDFLFDDEAWTVRWVVVDTGTWLSGRRVLLPPAALRRAADDPRVYATVLTKQEVKDSPDTATDRPVSRQMESSLYGHYGLNPYWGPGTAFAAAIPPAGIGAAVLPGGALHAPANAAGTKPGGVAEPAGDPHLRSVGEVTGYYVAASDGDIGHVEDFLVDDDGWALRYMIVDTKNWWPGKKVLVAPQWIDAVSWTDRHVRVRLTRDGVRNSPEFDPSRTVDRAYEARLHGHYGITPYWE